MNPVRICLQALVLLNLLFVQITGAAPSFWLAIMAALALAAPLLVRFAERLLYRLAWNAGVLAIFGLLVHDALQSGIQHLLEDGLVLAAFCQVHLLNNLSGKQKPDLLFFNSFLIALVTSFFCQDFEFVLVFVAYALVLLAGLQLAQLPLTSVARTGPLLRDAAWRGGVVLAATALVFLFWPRDFQREGLIEEQLALARAITSQTGFSEDVKLGQSGQTVQSTRIAMRVRLESGSRPLVPSYWRGATFTRFEEDGWKAVTQLQRKLRRSIDDAWLPRRSGQWQRPGRSGGPTLTVELLGSPRRLFTPLFATRLDTLPPTDPMLVSPLLDGTLRFDLVAAPRSDESACRYRITAGVEPRTRGGGIPHDIDSRLLLHVYVPPHLVPDRLRALTRQWRSELGPDAEQHEIVEHLRARLSEHCDYLLPGEAGAARDLADFIDGAAGGHCEYFATALALMLRTLGIPCRFVTGYLATEWLDDQQLVARDKDAHAWVEVHDPLIAWYVADATPPRRRTNAHASESWLGAAGAWLDELWRKVTSFDAKSKAELVDALARAPAALLAFVVAHPQGVLALVLVVVLAWLRRHHAAARRAVRMYMRAVRKLRVVRMPHETPRELLDRTRPRYGGTPAWNRLLAATQVHEARRYAGSCAPRMPPVLG